MSTTVRPAKAGKRVFQPVGDATDRVRDAYYLGGDACQVQIVEDRRSGTVRYQIVEPILSPKESGAIESIMDAISIRIQKEWREPTNGRADRVEETKNDFLEAAFDAAFRSMRGLYKNSRDRIWYYVRRDLLGFGPIHAMMIDDNVEDISCNGSNVPVYVYHREHGSLPTALSFTEDALNRMVLRLAQKSGKHISVADPILDAALPDGSRIHATMKDEVTSRGSTFTIRRFSHMSFHPGVLVRHGTFSAAMVAYMWFMIERGANVLFAGTTASGKTTSLNALSLFIPEDDKIVSIEDTREIDLYHQNWIPGLVRGGFGEVVGGQMQGEVSMFDLLKASLRMRPNYLLVSEIRGREAHVLFQAMATGHATLSTVHAGSVDALFRRLISEPISVPAMQLENLDVVVIQVSTRRNGRAVRRAEGIFEINDFNDSTGRPHVRAVFERDAASDRMVQHPSRQAYRFSRDAGTPKQEIAKELNRRIQVVKWMAHPNRTVKQVVDMIRLYQRKPERAVHLIRGAAPPIKRG